MVPLSITAWMQWHANCFPELLAPLTSVTDLPSHPTLSRPFTSSALTDLASQGRNLMHKENAALSKVRPLLTQLSGDHTWASCEMFLGPNDNEFFDNGFMLRMAKRRKIQSQPDDEQLSSATKLNGSSVPPPAANGEPSQVLNGTNPNHHQPKTSNEGVAMVDGHIDGDGKQAHENQDVADIPNARGPPSLSQIEAESIERTGSAGLDGKQTNDDELRLVNGDSGTPKNSKGKGKEPETRIDSGDNGVVMMDGGARVGHNQLAQPSSHPPSNDNEAASLLTSLMEESFIHPIFLAPKSAHPDRNLGLPDQEAEDVRRLLQLYVQKQEEVCRGARKLYEGLLMADRRRKTVLGWSKAEAHCGPNRDMSDGEDWYDKDEWGLEEELKKGQDEEEEDTTQTQKKTRNRTK